MPRTSNRILSPRKRQQLQQQQSVPSQQIKRPKIFLVEEEEEKNKLNKKQQQPVLLWVDKYKPKTIKQIIGQQTDKSPTNKLLDWLKNWAKYHLTSGEKKKATKKSPFGQHSDGSMFKAALLSGPPGIGKTTAAELCCKELDLNYVIMNASDVRNKAAIEKRSEQLTCNQMEQYCSKDGGQSPIKSTSKRPFDHLLIMDEVDGMSGNADRAGMSELIQMLKRTKVPIICICNDRQSMKVRSLANYCYDLRFQKPRVEQIKGCLLSIAAKENLKLPKEFYDKIIEASCQDIRQSINTLQMIISGKMSLDFQKKDILVNIFEAARQILSPDTSLSAKFDLFFTDYSLMPLFVQENYPNVRDSKMSNLDHINAIRRSSNAISFGDILGKQIRTGGNWSLLREQAMFSCVLPATFMDGYMTAQISFPSWLGKNSNFQKRQRLLRQLALHMHLKIEANIQSLVLDYLPVLSERLYRPLIEKDSLGVPEVISLYKYYYLVKDDSEAINELSAWPHNKQNKDLASMVSTKAKSALTRQLNKEKRFLPFAQLTDIKTGRKKGGGETKGKDKGFIVDDDSEDKEETENSLCSCKRKADSHFNVEVKLMDSDTLPWENDDEMGKANTDLLGNYTVEGCAGDFGHWNDPDPYILITHRCPEIGHDISVIKRKLKIPINDIKYLPDELTAEATVEVTRLDLECDSMRA
ncbi:AAA domain-containing protein [Meloidogyne graminicola]|uniref:AAA domain-containing protein n=1 Tax=Meloidogyne graminicola TaxID=189291 RepID=A0A8S9ZN67_9BILA|nr:AAA domain-containing protein [Meloidogyne graminicola]